MQTFKLYGANVCPFVHRTRLVLAEKEIDHEYVAIDLRNKPDWYHEVLPHGKVPLLERGSLRVWESSIICEYLEDFCSEPALLPVDPGERAGARLWLDWAANEFVPTFYKLLKEQGESEQAEHAQVLRAQLERMDGELRGKTYFLGESLSLVDLEIYPWFERWPILEHYRNFEVPADLEALSAWRQRMSKRPATQKLEEPASFYIEQYRHYAHPV